MGVSTAVIEGLVAFSEQDADGVVLREARLRKAEFGRVESEGPNASLAFESEGARERPGEALGPATLTPEQVRWAVRHGLLVTRRECPPEAPVVQATSGTGRAAPGAHLQRVQGQMAEAESAGRVPVYFVNDQTQDHLPLALGMIQAHLKEHLPPAMREKYELLDSLDLEISDLMLCAMTGPPAVWLFSNYIWSHSRNLELSEHVKRLSPQSVCVHGGPNVPKREAQCTELLNAHRHVDVAVRGEGEATVTELLDALEPVFAAGDWSAVSGVRGVTFRNGDELVRTAEQPRIEDLDSIPSPYLGGVFDLAERPTTGVIETNRGCPYGCSFCDWGSATMQKVRRFDLDRVRREIEWLGVRRVPVLWIADANFGIFERDVEITQAIVESNRRTGFPREVVVNYAKHGSPRLATIVQLLCEAGICSQGIVAVQTRDEATLASVSRQNIAVDKYASLAGAFRSQGLPLSADLMIGLPGATVESFCADLQYYLDEDVLVKAYRTQLLVNSPMADAEHMERFAIETGDHDFLVATSSYTRDDLQTMLDIYALYRAFEGYSGLRYVLRYLQWDHDTPALDAIRAVLAAARADPESFPLVTWAVRYFEGRVFVPGGWMALYREIEGVLASVLAPGRTSLLELTFRANDAVLPCEGRAYPHVLHLEHDIAAYVADHRAGAGRPLAEYPPAVLEVTDPHELSSRVAGPQYDTHQIFWELQSRLESRRSNPHFLTRSALSGRQEAAPPS